MAKTKAKAKGHEKTRRKIAELEAKLAGLRAELEGPPVSPLAVPFPDLPPVAGVRLSAAAAGVRYRGRLDVMLAELAAGSVMAGTFTRSATRAAPVLWCEKRLAALARSPNATPLGIVVNAGNANAFTGRGGTDAVASVAGAVGKALRTPKGNVFMASTGVIGEPLPHDRIEAVLGEMAERLSDTGLPDAARAILTTDTFPKGAFRQIDIGGHTVTIAGIAKGSGMIAPDMATMLAFVFTDAAIDQRLLQTATTEATAETFNCVTVDGDTSTSDTILVGATGRAGHPPIGSVEEPGFAAFRDALSDVMRDLALQVVRDGEGATKLVRIDVTGAKSDAAARIIGLAIANSPLVKTAIAGEDPNWGRIVMAIGKSGEAASRDRLTIRFGDVLVAEHGWVAEGYREEDGARIMTAPEIEIGVDVGVGRGRASVWTCDLTKRYVEINADYRS